MLLRAAVIVTVFILVGIGGTVCVNLLGRLRVRIGGVFEGPFVGTKITQVLVVIIVIMSDNDVIVDIVIDVVVLLVVNIARRVLIYWL